MRLTIRLPSDERVTWGEKAAASAVGKPLLDSPTDGAQIGTVMAARVEGGDLVLEVEVDHATLEYDLAAEAVRGVALVRQPFYPPRGT